MQRALSDAALRHALDLIRYSNSEVSAILRLLNAADRELFTRMRNALERFSPGKFSVRRLDAQLKGVWELNERVYRVMADRSAEALRELVEYELAHQAKSFSTLLPADRAAEVGVPALDQVYSAISNRPLQGRLMGEWFETLGAARQQRMQDALRMGFVNGETVDEMIRRIRGTRAANFADGIINTDRRHAEAIVRTATHQYAAGARAEFYSRNDDLIAEEQWSSVLDNRTTDLCMVRDGLRYTTGDHEPIGHKVPWLAGPGAIHWNCRSVSIPILRGMEDEPPSSERAAMGGVVNGKTTFRDWVLTQPESVQRDILGARRAELIKSGKVKFSELFDARGSFLTLDELRERSGL